MPGYSLFTTVTIPTVGGSVVVSDLPSMPQLLIFFANGRATDGLEDNYRSFMGLSTGAGVNYTPYSLREETNEAGVKDSQRTWSSTRCILLMNGTTGTIDAEASVSALSGNGYTLTVQTNPSSDKLISVLAVGGITNFEAELFDFAINSGVTGTQDIDASEGCNMVDPLFVQLMGAQSTDVSGTITDDAHMNLGFTDFTNQFAMANVSNNGPSGNTQGNRRTRAATLITMRTNAASITGEALVTIPNTLPVGFQLNITNDFTSAYRVVGLAIKGVEIHVGSYAAASSISTINVTSPGFEATLAFFASIATTAVGGAADDFLISLGGASSSTARGTISSVSQDGVDPSDTSDRRSSTKMMQQVDSDNLIVGEQDYLQSTDDGFDISQTDGSPTADLTFFWTMRFESVSNPNLRGNFNLGLKGGFQ